MKRVVAWSVGIFLFGVFTVGIIGGTMASDEERALAELDRQEKEIRSELLVLNEERTQKQTIYEAAKADLDATETVIIQKREQLAKVWEQQNHIITPEEPPAEPEPEPAPEEAEEVAVLDMDKLAHAISMAETSGCTKGYGVEYNNCFGIKNGSIAPCERIGRNNMCIYDHTDQSFDAFKKIWELGYGGKYPTSKMAAAWTGNDRPDDWLNNVHQYYYN